MAGGIDSLEWRGTDLHHLGRYFLRAGWEIGELRPPELSTFPKKAGGQPWRSWLGEYLRVSSCLVFAGTGKTRACEEAVDVAL